MKTSKQKADIITAATCPFGDIFKASKEIKKFTGFTVKKFLLEVGVPAFDIGHKDVEEYFNRVKEKAKQ